MVTERRSLSLWEELHSQARVQAPPSLTFLKGVTSSDLNFLVYKQGQFNQIPTYVSQLGNTV